MPLSMPLIYALGLLVSTSGGPAGEPQQPATTPVEPDLTALEAPRRVIAAGESDIGSRTPHEPLSVLYEGETIALQLSKIKLEGTSVDLLRRRPIESKRR